MSKPIATISKCSGREISKCCSDGDSNFEKRFVATAQLGFVTETGHIQYGLDVKTKDTKEMVETVEVDEEMDEEQKISEEVSRYGVNDSHLKTSISWHV